MLPIDVPGYYQGKLPGALMGVSVDGYRFDCETQGEFSVDTELIAINAKQSGRFPRKRPGKMSWSVTTQIYASMTSQYGDFKHVLNKMLLGHPVTIEFGTVPGIEPYYKITGQAYAKNLNISAVIGEKVGSAITFEGSGPFETDWNQFALVLRAQPADEDKPIYVQTFNWP